MNAQARNEAARQARHAEALRIAQARIAEQRAALAHVRYEEVYLYSDPGPDFTGRRGWW